MPKLNWDGNDFRNSQDSSGAVADNISRNGNLQQGYNHGSLTRGLVAYYPMEKGQGQILHDGAFDNIGQIKPGASGGNTTTSDMWASGKVGNNALNFDGTDDYIESSPSLESKTEFTVSGWILRDTTGNWDVIVSNTGTSSGTLSYSLRVNSNDKPDFGIFDGSTFVNVVGNTTLSTSQWYHILGSYNKTSGELKVYVDGSQDGTTSTTITPQSAPISSIAREAHSGRYFDGKIDDVRVYSRALSEPEIKALANLSQPSGVEKTEKSVPGQSEGGISRYKLDGTADDTWGNNHGTNNGADLTATGIYGQAGDFDSGANNSIGIPDLPSLSAYSVSGWVNVNALNTNRMLIHDGKNNRFQIRGESDGSWNFIRYNGSGYDRISIAGSENIWQFLVGVWNGNEMRLYLNGKIEASKASINSGTGSNSVYIGANSNSTGSFFDGKIDDVRIYDKALTPLQVEKLYHKGAYRIPRESTLQ